MMKSKRQPQTLTSRLIMWSLPIPMAFSLFFIQAPMISYVTALLRPGGSSLIYISTLVNDYEQYNLVAFIGLSLWIVYLMMIRRHRLRAIIVWGTGAAFLLFMMVWLIEPSPYFFKPVNLILQTLRTSDHTYQLIEQKQCHHGCSYSYIILECDSTGWMCHNYGISSQRVMQPIDCKRPTHIASLAQNPITHHLELTVDGEMHVLHPTDDIPVYPFSWDRCGLGLSRS